jgi:hypothetical protein
MRLAGGGDVPDDECDDAVMRQECSGKHTHKHPPSESSNRKMETDKCVKNFVSFASRGRDHAASTLQHMMSARGDPSTPLSGECDVKSSSTASYLKA